MEYLKRHQRKREDAEAATIPVLIPFPDQDDRPFACKDCSKAFARRSVSTRHWTVPNAVHQQKRSNAELLSVMSFSVIVGDATLLPHP